MNSEQESACMQSIDRVMAIFGGKWSFIIIDALHEGPRRFNQLGKSLHINTKSLTDALKHLEAHGIVKRTVFPTVPVTVEYELTPRGRAFDAVLDAMKDWAGAWLGEGAAGGSAAGGSAAVAP